MWQMWNRSNIWKRSEEIQSETKTSRKMSGKQMPEREMDKAPDYRWSTINDIWPTHCHKTKFFCRINGETEAKYELAKLEDRI